ncbi:hypothetical protein MSPP1_001393 [Malassezia sp. CBS 17886]|nr:hypothetical protein MSPP1_001393 [Malassezia sp. CBS 17886]
MDTISVAELSEYIRSLRVASLKEHIKLFNEKLPFAPHMRVTGNKPDLAQRLRDFIESASHVPKHYEELLVVMGPIGLFQWLGDLRKMRNANSQYGRSRGGALTRRYVEWYGRPPGADGMPGAAGDADAPRSAPARPAAHDGERQTALQRLRFWPSPFYEPTELVSSIIQVPEAPVSTGRRQVVVAFSLSAQQRDLLKDTRTAYQLRLLCTTFEHYMACVSTPRFAAPVEFPYTSEASVNGRALGVSLKGNKKHAGRVSPPDLNRNGSVTLLPGRLNRVELTYANAPNRHALAVALCRITSAEQLTEQLKQRQFRSKDEVEAKMQQQASDEDVVTGASTLKLTCPLTYMRMVTPCRANACDHIQCFDALSFYSLNEQSPQWLCPVCNRHVRSDDLRMDGYVDEILRRVPGDVDTVLVEPDGVWRTLDNRYNTSSALQTPPTDDVSSLFGSPERKTAIDSSPDAADAWASAATPGARDGAASPGAGPPAATPATQTGPATPDTRTGGANSHGTLCGRPSGPADGESPPRLVPTCNGATPTMDAAAFSSPPARAAAPTDVIDLTFSSDEDAT